MRLLIDTCTFLWLAADDPFDRGLVSQAILHGMTLVTPDADLARYPAPTLW